MSGQERCYPLSKHILVEITNGTVDISWIEFDDRILINITQFGKFGTLIHSCKDVNPEASRYSLQTSDPVSFTNKVLFGIEKPEMLMLTRSLTAKLDRNKPLLYSLSLKDFSIETLKIIENSIVDLGSNLA
ncbi:DgyrCDS11251 [Dimorphilus gyrociliatus]|uniref:DgyrCDS11251 n=1 Tax=Dimorphilus gyrociliatus TaxID=2664684 RepID=A0A7I8W2P7_9ANNE|nr:DgyrCDS11251 [Dimorphilus gyrociliatus]